MTNQKTGPQYSVNDFDAYNSAVDSEVARVAALSESVRVNNWHRKAIVACWSSLAVAILLIAGAVAYKILSSPKLEFGRGSASSENLSKLENSPSSEDPLITTNFVVFDKTTTAAGDVVATGKEYRPDNLEYPYWQYCYLEITSNSGTKSNVTLATARDGKIKIQSGGEQHPEALSLCTLQTF